MYKIPQKACSLQKLRYSKPHTLNTPPFWTPSGPPVRILLVLHPCFMITSWFWMWTHLSVRTVCNDLVNVNIERKHRPNKVDNYSDWRHYRATDDGLYDIIRWTERKRRSRRERMKRFWNKYFCLSQAAFLSRQYWLAVIAMVCHLELLLASAQHLLFC